MIHPQSSAPIQSIPAVPVRGVAPSGPSLCINTTYNNGRVCIDVPVLGTQCVTIPGLPSGTGSAKVCAEYLFPSSAKICAWIGSYQIGCVTV